MAESLKKESEPFDGVQVGTALGAQLKALISDRLAGVDGKLAAIDARFASMPAPVKPADPVVNVTTPEVNVAVNPTPVTVAPNLNFTASPVEVNVDMKEMAGLVEQLLSRPLPEDKSEAFIARIEKAAASINAQLKASSEALVAALTAEKTIVNGPDGKPASLKVK
jgi:hypothetical protein